MRKTWKRIVRAGAGTIGSPGRTTARTGTTTQATFVTNVFVADALVQVVQPTVVRVTVIMEKSTPAGNGR